MPIAPPPQLKAGLFARGSGTLKPPKATPTGAPPPKAPKGVPVEHRIGIQAPAEVIWGLIHDLASWETWNPTYPKASGDIHIGSTLEMTLQLPGQTPQQILSTDAIAVFDEFGFREHLTPQRSNGLRSMVERIRSDAREALAAAS